MTTTCAGRQYEDENEVSTSGGFLVKSILLAVLIVGGYLIAIPVLESTLAPPEVPVAVPVRTDTNTLVHTQKHADAAAIRQCLDDKGASEVWKSRSWRQPNTYFRVCDISNGRVGVMLVRWAGKAGVWREATSFVVKDGKPQQTVEYLSARSRLVWSGR